MNDYDWDLDTAVEIWLDSFLPEITVETPDHDPWL